MSSNKDNLITQIKKDFDTLHNLSGKLIDTIYPDESALEEENYVLNRNLVNKQKIDEIDSNHQKFNEFNNILKNEPDFFSQQTVNELQNYSNMLKKQIEEYTELSITIPKEIEKNRRIVEAVNKNLNTEYGINRPREEEGPSLPLKASKSTVNEVANDLAPKPIAVKAEVKLSNKEREEIVKELEAKYKIVKAFSDNLETNLENNQNKNGQDIRYINIVGSNLDNLDNSLLKFKSNEEITTQDMERLKFARDQFQENSEHALYKAYITSTASIPESAMAAAAITNSSGPASSSIKLVSKTKNPPANTADKGQAAEHAQLSADTKAGVAPLSGPAEEANGNKLNAAGKGKAATTSEGQVPKNGQLSASTSVKPASTQSSVLPGGAVPKQAGSNLSTSAKENLSPIGKQLSSLNNQTSALNESGTNVNAANPNETAGGAITNAAKNSAAAAKAVANQSTFTAGVTEKDYKTIAEASERKFLAKLQDQDKEHKFLSSEKPKVKEAEYIYKDLHLDKKGNSFNINWEKSGGSMVREFKADKQEVRVTISASSTIEQIADSLDVNRDFKLALTRNPTMCEKIIKASQMTKPPINIDEHSPDCKITFDPQDLKNFLDNNPDYKKVIQKTPKPPDKDSPAVFSTPKK